MLDRLGVPKHIVKNPGLRGVWRGNEARLSVSLGNYGKLSGDSGRGSSFLLTLFTMGMEFC